MSHIPVWIHTKFISFNLTARHWTFKHLVKGAGHDAWLTCDSFYEMVSIFFFLILKIKSIIIITILGKIVLHSSKEIISNMFDKSAFTIQKVQHELLLMQHSVPRGYRKELWKRCLSINQSWVLLHLLVLSVVDLVCSLHATSPLTTFGPPWLQM